MRRTTRRALPAAQGYKADPQIQRVTLRSFGDPFIIDPASSVARGIRHVVERARANAPPVPGLCLEPFVRPLGYLKRFRRAEGAGKRNVGSVDPTYVFATVNSRQRDRPLPE